MKKLIAVLVLLSACSEVRVIPDSGSDGGSPSCLRYINVIGRHAPDCNWESWQCLPGQLTPERFNACFAAAEAVSGQCAQIEELLVSESCAP